VTRLRMDSRIARRRAEVRHERMLVRRRRTLIGIAFAAVVALGVAIERSSLVALSAVEVDGVTTVAAEDVRGAADLPLGTSTLRLRLGPASERVEALPAVREATVRRVDPLTVRIEVVERRPVVALRGSEGEALLDREGVVVSHGEGGDLPTIEVAAEGLPDLGESVSEHAAAANAFVFHRTLPGPLRSEVASYLARGPDDLDLLLERGAVARLGRARRVPEKARALGALLDDLPTEPGWTLDVRAPTNPVVVPPGADDEPDEA
jgi:cell division protein FtsQ